MRQLYARRGLSSRLPSGGWYGGLKHLGKRLCRPINHQRRIYLLPSLKLGCQVGASRQTNHVIVPQCARTLNRIGNRQTDAVSRSATGKGCKRKAKVHSYSATIAAYAVAAALSSQTEPAYSLSRSQARGHGLWTVAIQPCVTQVCRLMVSTSVIHVNVWFTTHLPTPVGRKAELA